MTDSPSTPRRTRAVSAPPSQPSSSVINTFSVKVEHCEFDISFFVNLTNNISRVKAAQTTTPDITNVAAQLEATPQAASLPAIPEVAEPKLEALETEPSNPDVQPIAPTRILSPEALDDLLEQLETQEQQDAARTGWAHAAIDRTNDSLLKLYPGQKFNKTAANKGWKTWHMEDARLQGLDSFWCEKAPECLLDQYLKQDSRPCVSNYFGRNKRNTARIPNMVTWCRKHYQRSGYRGRKNPTNNLEWPREKAGLILEQLRRNEEGYLGDTGESLTYTVTLKRSEQDRVNHHNNHGGTSPQPDPLAKSFQAPIDILLHIFNVYVGEHKTYNECRALTHWAEAHLDKKTCPDLPLWEMVPEYPDFEDVSGDEAEDEDNDEDMDDEDDTDPVTPKKPSPKKPTSRKSTPKKPSPKKAALTPKKTPARLPLATRASSAKKGRVTEQGSVQKPQ